MKILHAVLSQGFYGSERYCAELAAEQAREGHDVEILIHDPWSDCAREMRKAVALANTIGAGTLRLTIMPRWVPAMFHRLLALRAIRRFRPDVVHTHLNPAARRVGREAQKFNIPHVATLHLTYAAREVGDCDGLICIAAWQLDTLEGFSGETAVVHNWLPVTVADALMEVTPRQIANVRQACGADDETFVFGTVGRLMPEKGVDLLVRVFRAIFPQGMEPVRLVIVGGGDHLADIARAAGHDPRIVFAGVQENVAPIYRAFDAYVSAARFEPFGLSILEAMAAGCPLVLTRTQGPAEFVTDERVLWAPVDDEVLLATRLVEAFERGHRRIEYDLKAFTPKRAAEQIEALYRRAIKRRGK
jgi:glycosyltransferase involved in cell wall biosynthesis